jgi:hypothetical protein
MSQLSTYQHVRLDQAKRALAASLTDEDNPKAYAKHLGAVEVELADIVVPGSPGCLPGRRFPRSRSDRSAPFFLYGLSDDGGRDDVDESLRA